MVAASGSNPAMDAAQQASQMMQQASADAITSQAQVGVSNIEASSASKQADAIAETATNIAKNNGGTLDAASERA